MPRPLPAPPPPARVHSKAAGSAEMAPWKAWPKEGLLLRLALLRPGEAWRCPSMPSSAVGLRLTPVPAEERTPPGGRAVPSHSALYLVLDAGAIENRRVATSGCLA